MRRWWLGLALFCLCASAHAALKQGDVAHDDLGKDREGHPVTVSMHRGKVVVVSFWASWCGPCLKELPIIENLQRAAGKEHLAVVAVNFMEDRNTYRAMNRRLKVAEMTLTHDISGRLSAPYEVKALPFMLIIGKDGRIAEIHRGYSEEMLEILVEQINELLAKDVTEPSSAS